jgi:hypothetical protein
MKKKLFYLVLLSLIGCRKTPEVDCNNKTRDLELGRCLIIGEWNFVKVVRTLDENKTYDPKDIGINYKVNFKDNGIAEVFDDNWRLGYKYQDSVGYELTTYSKWSLNPLDTNLNVLIMRRGIATIRAAAYPFRICNDTLHLDDEYHTHNGQYFLARK